MLSTKEKAYSVKVELSLIFKQMYPHLTISIHIISSTRHKLTCHLTLFMDLCIWMRWQNLFSFPIRRNLQPWHEWMAEGTLWLASDQTNWTFQLDSLFCEMKSYRYLGAFLHDFARYVRGTGQVLPPDPPFPFPVPRCMCLLLLLFLFRLLLLLLLIMAIKSERNCKKIINKVLSFWVFVKY